MSLPFKSATTTLAERLLVAIVGGRSAANEPILDHEHPDRLPIVAFAIAEAFMQVCQENAERGEP